MLIEGVDGGRVSVDVEGYVIAVADVDGDVEFCGECPFRTVGVLDGAGREVGQALRLAAELPQPGDRATVRRIFDSASASTLAW